MPPQAETIQSFLRKVEDRPELAGVSQIVVQSDGRKLAGVSADVRQVMSLRDFAEAFYGVEDTGLSDRALEWLMEAGKAKGEVALSETARRHYFPDGGLEQAVLRVFVEAKDQEREVVLWVARTTAKVGSYLESVMRLSEAVPPTFLSAYIAGGVAGTPGAVGVGERREAILQLGAERAEVDIRQFIASRSEVPTSQIAPWLNCGTKAERAELLRRCAKDGIVSKVVKDVYREVAAYMGDGSDSAYFRQYRELKLSNRVTAEFCEMVRHVEDRGATSRESLLQQYASDQGCALLVVDAMGAEWLPMLVSVAQERDLGVESAVIGAGRLPTATSFNVPAWQADRRLPDIKRFDNIAHNGAERHEAHSPEENLVEQLEVVAGDILPKVADALTRYERVVLTADHGSSRLAVLAWEQNLSGTLAAPRGAEILDWRYCRKGHAPCPPELEETLDGNFWVVRGYERLPKGGGGGFERHGGGALEERLVPVVVFSRRGRVAAQQPVGRTVEFTENEDFDL